MNVEQIEAKLARARQALEQATGASSAANAAADRHTINDPGALSGIRRKPNRTADNARWNSYSRAAEAQLKLDRLRNNVDVLERALTDARAEADRKRFTREDFAGATLVKDWAGWHKVARVNQTTVSVETGYSWVDRIPFDKVTQIHKPEPQPLNALPKGK